MSVRNWLKELGLEDFAELFEDNLIDEDVLVQLTESDLVELGLPLGPRVRVRAALEQLRSGETIQGATSASEPEAHESLQPASAERRRLTVMFVDLVGSTALQTRLDPEDMSEMIRAYQDTCAGVVTRFSGYVAKYMGDGVLAYFGWPQTHEDEVAQAVRAGLAIVESVSDIRGPDGTVVQARVGLATGLVVVGDLVGEDEVQERAVVGETPNLAARLQGEAHPNQVVISDSARSLLGRQFDVEDLGERRLKGIEEPTRVFAVRGENVVESRFEARQEALLPIFGREHELALIMDRWRRATVGEGQGVALIGEAGIGKSRTVRAVLDELAGGSYARVRYQCSPNHVDSALWPVVRQLTAASKIKPDDDPEVRRTKLSSAIVQTVDDAEDALFLARLLGLEDDDESGSDMLDPAVQRSRTLEALVRQLLVLAQGQPALVVLEDAHWSDPTTLELIERTLAAIEEARVMVLITSRPDQQPQLDAYPHMSRVALNRLGREGLERIVRELSPGRELSSELIDEIITKTDGVPLFAEELTKTVLETGGTDVPATLHDSLMARLDRIGEVKEIAQVAACIGREFDYRLLSAIVDATDDELQQALDKLGNAALVFRRGTPPDARYTFKHTLLQDAAYESLLKSRRKETHTRIADVLENQLLEVAATEPELVAFHLTAAQQPARAIPYWEKAGRRSVERSANTEAVGHLSEALNASKLLPEGTDKERIELGIYAEMAGPLMTTKGYNAPETAEVYRHVQDLVTKLGDNTLMFPALYQQWIGPLITGASGQALSTAKEFVSLAEGQSDPALILMGQRILGISLFELGHHRDAADSLTNVERLYRANEHEDLRFRFGQDPFAAAMSFRGIVHFCMGELDAAVSDVDAAVNRADAVNHANTAGYVGAVGGQTLAWALDDRQLVREVADKTIALSDRYGMILWRGYSRIFWGWCAALDEDPESGFKSIAAGFEDLRASRTSLHLRQFMTMHADALHAAHRYQEGLGLIEKAFDSTPEERWEEPEMYRVKGNLLIALDRPTEGLAALERSLELSLAQGAPGWELRTAISLALASREVGAENHSRDVLRAACMRITGGKETPLVQTARSLLEG